MALFFAEIRRTFTVLLTAVRALFAFVPFSLSLLFFLFTGRSVRRRIGALLADTRPVSVDEPPPTDSAPARIYVIAGEDSGDLHAANLIAAIRKMAPGVRIRGMGGPRMQEAGCLLDFDLTRMSVMGVWPVLRATGTFFGLFRKLLRRFETDPPDVLVTVDYPGFNLRAGRMARRLGVKVVSYIAPQVWAWAPWRISRIAASVDRLLTILPFERELFRRRGLETSFVGHPLFEHLQNSVPASDVPSVPARLGLLPGSRSSEVESLLPGMLDAARRIVAARPEVRLILPYRRPSLRPLIDEILATSGGGLPIELVEGRTHEVMRDLSVALVASGTATLELAYYRVPMVVLYRVGRIGSLFRPLVLVVKDVALVNIVAGRRIVPEFVGPGVPAERCAEQVLSWLADQALALEVREELSRVRGRLTTTGAAERAAGFVLAACREVRRPISSVCPPPGPS